MASDGDNNQEMKVRTGQAKTATKQINSLFWSLRIRKRNNNLRIYKTIVESVGLYRAEPVSYTHLDVYKRQE